ncbi:MAG: TonB-dependent receptor, partial [Pseudomonadota bacterium]
MKARFARARGRWTAAAAVACLPAAGDSLASTQSEPGSEPLEEIVVTATRRGRPLLKVPASMTVQDLAELRRKGFAYGTDEFRGVPGVFFRRGEGDGEEFPFVSIRGVTGNHGNDTFLALVDGIPFVGPDEEVLLFEVPYPVVDTVEVVRGPVSALYGRGAIAGAVNYRTRALDRDRAEVSFSAGTDDLQRLTGQWEKAFDSGAGLLLSAAYEDFEGWRENSRRRFSSAFVKGKTPLGERGTAAGWLTYYNRESEVPGVIPTLGDGTVVDVVGGEETFLGYRPTRNDREGLIAAARYTFAATESLEFDITGQLRSFDSDVRLNFYDFFEFDAANTTMGVNGFGSVSDATVYFAEATMNWSTGRHAIVAGLSSERATLDEEDRWSGEIDPFFTGECGFRFYAILIDYSTGAVTNDDPGNPCFVRDQLRTAAETDNTFYGAFVQDEIRLTERLELTLGVRYDRFEREVVFDVVGTQPVDQRASGDADAWSPKAALSYDYGNGIVYTSYGRGFNSNFGPVFQWEPDRYARDERPTTIDSFEVGWKGRAADGRVAWETAVFFLEQEDRRIFVSNPDADGPPTLATTGQQYSSQGFEGSIRLALTERTAATASYTFLDPEWDELIIAG